MGNIKLSSTDYEEMDDIAQKSAHDNNIGIDEYIETAKIAYRNLLDVLAIEMDNSNNGVELLILQYNHGMIGKHLHNLSSYEAKRLVNIHQSKSE